MDARASVVAGAGAEPPGRSFTALSEPFDTYWQGTRDLERGYRQFATYYKANYIPRLPTDRAARVAVLTNLPALPQTQFGYFSFRNK
jgi:hypothetical protein